MFAVMIALLIVGADLTGIEMINNAYVDYFTTIRGVQDVRYGEGNPISAEIIRMTTYEQQKFLGGMYLIGLSFLTKLPEPYNIALPLVVNIGHFVCGYTWVNGGWLRNDMRLTLLYIKY